MESKFIVRTFEFANDLENYVNNFKVGVKDVKIIYPPNKSTKEYILLGWILESHSTRINYQDM